MTLEVYTLRFANSDISLFSGGIKFQKHCDCWETDFLLCANPWRESLGERDILILTKLSLMHSLFLIVFEYPACWFPLTLSHSYASSSQARVAPSTSYVPTRQKRSYEEDDDMGDMDIQPQREPQSGMSIEQMCSWMQNRSIVYLMLLLSECFNMLSLVFCKDILNIFWEVL